MLRIQAGNSNENTKYLIDTSAFYPLIRRLRLGIVDIVEHLVVLDLTLYEIGNTIWKEYKRGLVENPKKTMEMFSLILESIEQVRIKPEWLNDILETALRHNLTFYDASYAYVSMRYNLVLVTEDNDLLGTVENSIRVRELLSKLGIEQQKPHNQAK